MWYRSWGQVTCAFSLTIPSSVSHIGLLDAPWGPAIGSVAIFV